MRIKVKNRELRIKLKKRTIRIGLRWLPVLYIIILPQVLIDCTPLPEHVSRLLASLGLVIEGTLILLWAAISCNPKPMTALQKRRITVERYNKGRRFSRILQVILLFVVVSGTWFSIIPSLFSAYHYIESKTVVYVKGSVSMISAPRANYWLDESMYIEDDEGHSHEYSINYSPEMIHENDCVELYELPPIGMILSINKLSNSDACGFEMKTMKDPTW